MMKKIPLGFALILLTWTGCANKIAINKNVAFEKIKKIAVLGFSTLDDSPGLGTTVANEFNFALLKYGFTVVERSYIQQILQEQNLTLSGAVSAKDLKDFGNLIGTDAVILGAIERFKPEESNTIYYPDVQQEYSDKHKSSGYQLGTVKSLSRTSNAYKYQQSSLSVSFRMVDVVTGEIIAAGSDSVEADTGITSAKQLALVLVKRLKKNIHSVIKKQKKIK